MFKPTSPPPMLPPSPFVDEWLPKFAKISSDQRLLDVGCGEGRNSLFAAILGYDVTAIDLEKSLSPEAREHLAISFQAMNLLDIGREDGLRQDFDIVICNETLSKLPVRDRAIGFRALMSAVRPNGFALVSDYTSDFHSQGIKGFLPNKLREPFDRAAWNVLYFATQKPTTQVYGNGDIAMTSLAQIIAQKP